MRMRLRMRASLSRPPRWLRRLGFVACCAQRAACQKSSQAMDEMYDESRLCPEKVPDGEGVLPACRQGQPTLPLCRGAVAVASSSLSGAHIFRATSLPASLKCDDGPTGLFRLRSLFHCKLAAQFDAQRVPRLNSCHSLVYSLCLLQWSPHAAAQPPPTWETACPESRRRLRTRNPRARPRPQRQRRR